MLSVDWICWNLKSTQLSICQARPEWPSPLMKTWLYYVKIDRWVSWPTVDRIVFSVNLIVVHIRKISCGKQLYAIFPHCLSRHCALVFRDLTPQYIFLVPTSIWLLIQIILKIPLNKNKYNYKNIIFSLICTPLSLQHHHPSSSP